MRRDQAIDDRFQRLVGFATDIEPRRVDLEQPRKLEYGFEAIDHYGVFRVVFDQLGLP
jgi:hypothetical protein